MTILDIENILKQDGVNAQNFEKLALEIFEFQYRHCAIYTAFVDALHKNSQQVKTLLDIPFLPISFFKSHQVISPINDTTESDLTFLSSGTTSDQSSQHHILNKSVYEYNLLNNFRQFYGDPQQYIFIGLLPSYLEKGNSSLVYMCQHLMHISGQPESHFYLHDYQGLYQLLTHWQEDKKPFLIGVTYALLDFVEQYRIEDLDFIVMETGGMKGRKKELTRAQVHDILCSRLSVDNIHSEYGMTELLSQAYSKAQGIFYPASTLKVLVRDQYNPLEIHQEGQGLVNIIDLANIYSCSFIATDDIGKIHSNHSFEILGRADHSALRGCSLLAIRD